MLEKLSKAGKIGVNINGDLPEEEIKDRAEKFSKLVKIIWIGEHPFFKNPFEVAKLVAESCDCLVGFGVLTPRTGVEEIKTSLRELRKNYGDRFVLGLASGGVSLREFEKFVIRVKEFENFILCGVTWKKAFEVAKKHCCGVLFNHVHPDHIKAFAEFDGFKAAYGPALVFPSEFYQDLLIAGAIVMSTSKKFLEAFDYLEAFRKIEKVNVEELIKRKQSGEDLSEDEDFKKLEENKKIILEKFTISGSLENVRNRVCDLLELCDHVVLGDPFFRDEESPEKLSLLLSRLGRS